MSIAWTRLPFRFSTPTDYERQLSAWIGRAFYEVLPAAGYQVREEQIYFAFRVAAALAAGRPILAEAGSGTGKTFAYLLPAICHARLRARPVIVATASPALEEQLAGPRGDIAALSGLLGLEVDARVARRPEDVVCDIRLEHFAASRRRVAGRAALLRWADGSAWGARGEHGVASDELWEHVAWRPSCRCDLCPRRGFCRLTKGRDAARRAQDLIVCSHDLFFEDMFRGDMFRGDTFRRADLPTGRLPVLGAFSGVVFDEGHRVALAAQRAAGAHLRPSDLLQAVAGCEGQGVRLRLLRLAEAARGTAEGWGEALRAATAQGDAPRRPIAATPALREAAEALVAVLRPLQDEMAIEEGLHEETPYAARLAIFQVRLDAARAVCRGLTDPGCVSWVEGDEDTWVAPRDLGPLWQRHLPAGAPLVFSSATLAAGGSFAYAAARLGLTGPLTARVGVPFRLAAQVLCYGARDLPPAGEGDFWTKASARIAALLAATGGRALILLPDRAALEALRSHLRVPFPVGWEGEGAPDALLAAFRRDVASCLAGYSFWEGVDVPGASLSAVVIPVLPLPGADPIVQAQRDLAAARGADPFTAVDVPEMLLRLRQGVGRLIRTETDRGVIALLDGRSWKEEALAAAVASALPEGARHVRTLRPVARFLGTEG